MQIKLKKRLLDVATAPYLLFRFRDYYWARGKLFNDPMFTELLDRNVFPDRARVLDLGCGRGLLAAWLLAAERLAAEQQWTATCTPPKGLQFRGIELAADEARRGNTALQAVFGQRVALTAGDMRAVDMAGSDVIAILDVLHYIPSAEQDQLLDRIRAALGSGGLFVTRVGDAAGGWRFRVGQAVDCWMASLRNFRLARTWSRPLPEWRAALESRGFAVDALPMSSGTPFANVLLICRVA
jgi:SAM-dependent methyltransferase